MDEETNYIGKKLPNKVYISKRIEHTNLDGSTIPLRYVSKVMNSEKTIGFVKEKGVIQLRLTPSGKQEILAKILEVNNKIYVLSIQRYDSITGSPHKIHFSFIGREIKALRDFLDSIALLQFPDDKKARIEEADLLKIKSIFYKNPDIKLIEETLRSNVTSKDIVAIGYRKNQLEIFKKLLYEGYLSEYKKVIKMENSKDEKVWQYFFEKNEWIFGYGLDYRFQSILQKEFAASNSEADGSSTVFSDFLLGDKKFTTFVELKKPETLIWGIEKNRSNSWRFSNDLIDSISQILEQKASGQIKLELLQHDTDGREIKQRAYDSKVILIIGCWNQINGCEDKERRIKEKTFELFRRDSRNIEILTYDELYDRAKFIVGDTTD